MKFALGRLEEVNKELWLSPVGFLDSPSSEPARRQPAHGAQLLHAAHAGIGVHLRPASRDAHGVRQRSARDADDLDNLVLFAATAAVSIPTTTWLDITVWGGVLIVTGYSMGTLYEHKSAQLEEMRATYHGVLMILRHFVAKDPYTENHRIGVGTRPRLPRGSTSRPIASRTCARPRCSTTSASSTSAAICSTRRRA